jgi:DNA-binding transcriptional ArsR family regulator
LTKTTNMEGWVDRILSALRGGNRERAAALGTQTAALARELRATFVNQDRDPDLSSYELGGMDALAALMARANTSHSADAQRELLRRKHVPELLQLLATAREQSLIPTEIGQALEIEMPNVSRLLEAVRVAGLIERPQVWKQHRDGRVNPVRITQAGIRWLDELRPGWRSHVHRRHLKSDDNRKWVLVYTRVPNQHGMSTYYHHREVISPRNMVGDKENLRPQVAKKIVEPQHSPRAPVFH